MLKIKVKNFGPIRGGFQENEGWLCVNKVTVFIGSQGSGKSTLAKLISTCMWIEKALVRGDLSKQHVSYEDFVKFTEFHRIENYFLPDTWIGYKGEVYDISIFDKSISLIKKHKGFIKQPKIMYVPAERSFLSSIKNINKIPDLLVGSLKNFSIEFRKARYAFKNKTIELPVYDKSKVVYEAKEDENYIEFGEEKRLKLSEASSGFHSIAPLYWVTKYLTDFVKQDEEELVALLSTDQTIRRLDELTGLMNSEVEENKLRAEERKINQKYVSKYFVNIVEEPEQNLFPDSQRLLLHQLLAYNTGDNKLIMTTHSPYLIGYLTLAVEADKLKQRVQNSSAELQNRFNAIVPFNATLKGDKLVVYQLEAGGISKLKTYKDLPSDENYLNNGLAESNEYFSKLLDIEDELCR